MKKINVTQKDYENYLNDLVGYDNGNSNDEFIIGGKARTGYYGTLLRKYDPIAFQVGFREFKNDFNTPQR